MHCPAPPPAPPQPAPKARRRVARPCSGWSSWDVSSRDSKSAAERVVPAHVAAVTLLRVAVHQRTPVERVREAPHLVFEDEQGLAAPRVDNVAEAVLILVALLRDQPALQQA